MSTDLNHILRDEELVSQIMAHLDSEEAGETLEAVQMDAGQVKGTVESLASGLESEIGLRQEAIIRKYARPVLFIQDGKIQEPVIPLWKERVSTARERLEQVIPSIGRIELRGHPRFQWVGTGWLVAPRVIVTNRHVAETFAYSEGEGLEFGFDPIGSEYALESISMRSTTEPMRVSFRSRKFCILKNRGPIWRFSGLTLEIRTIVNCHLPCL